MDPLHLGQTTSKQITDEMLADPRWHSFHNFVKWALICCGLGMVVECAFLLPYILIRFGWGGS